MKHTKGPWKKEGTFVGSQEVGPTIASCNDEANAQLIAAAPEMLADLERALSVLEAIKNGETWDDECSFHTDCVKSTINKAKGGAE